MNYKEKLISKVKPEVLKALKNEAEIKYSSSYKAIIFSLTDIEDYRDLSIRQVQDLLIFLPNEFHPNGRTDFYYGDYLLQKKYQI
jgi:hypothetical protein|tara:strand:- start:227 stop:481 length:255 start_codon:yes stop_codon:yes gene_type:complete